jgi:hypothetical protein
MASKVMFREPSLFSASGNVRLPSIQTPDPAVSPKTILLNPRSNNLVNYLPATIHTMIYILISAYVIPTFNFKYSGQTLFIFMKMYMEKK